MKIVLMISLVKFVTNNVSESLSSAPLVVKVIACAFQTAPGKRQNVLIHAHVTLNVTMVATDVIIISVTSVMISKQMKIFTDAKMFLLMSLHNVWQHVAVHPLASSVVQAVMKRI